MGKWLNIGIGASNDQLKKDMNAAAQVVKAGSDAMGQAAVSGGQKMQEAQNKTASALKTLTQEYRTADKEAQMFAQTQGMSSEAFISAAQKAGQFKDQLGEVRAVSNAFASDTPLLTSSLGVFQGFAGAFSAAQGAAALFGGESENLQKAMVKLQAGMALTQGLQAVGQLSDSWAAFSVVIQTKALAAFNSLKIAIASNPIGAVAVLVASAAAAWMGYSSSVSKAAESESEYSQKGKSVYEILKEKTKLLSESNAKLSEEVLAKSKGLTMEQATYEANNKRLAQLAQEITLLERKNEAGSMEAGMNNVRIIAATEEAKLLRAYNEELEKNIKLTGTKATLTNNSLSPARAKAPGIIAIDTKVNMRAGSSNLQTSVSQALAGFTPQSMSNMMIPMDAFIQKSGQVKAVAIDLSSFIAQGLTSSFALLGETIGTIFDGSFSADALLGSMGEILTSMLSALGSAMIAAGVASQAFQTLFVNPLGAIAAGGALLVTAGIVRGLLKAGVSGGKSGAASGGGGGGGGARSTSSDFSSNGRTSFNGYSPVSAMIELGGVLKGNDIILSVKSSTKDRKRIV